MSIREGHSRRVSFDSREELGNKIDKLMVMIGKLAAKDSGRVRQFKPQIHQNRGRGQNRGYNQRNYQNRYRSDNRLNSRDRGKFRQDRGRHRFEQCTEEIISGKIQEIMADKTAEENIEMTVIGMIVMTDVGIGLEKIFLRNYGSNRTRSTSNSRSRSGSRASTNRDRIRCYKCREYNHFVRDYPTSREEREIEQLQQMLNLEENQTSLLTNAQNSQTENPRASPLNL